MEEQPVKQAFGSPGGKTQLAPKIVGMLPEHRIYKGGACGEKAEEEKGIYPADTSIGGNEGMTDMVENIQAKPTRPCRTCGANSWWLRNNGWGKPGWVCGGCHPQPK